MRQPIMQPHDMDESPEDQFIKSSYCGGGGCVEVAHTQAGNVAVRDAKDVAQQPLIFTQTEWKAFVQGVKAGEFDL